MHRVPGTTVRLLSNPSKMPGKSFSLPARKSCPREHGNICASCYADKGCYTWQTTQHAQDVRFRWTVECMRSAEGMRLWVETMSSALRSIKPKNGKTHFRVHDSGDMFSARYAEAWLMVARENPQIDFWIPTRSWQQSGNAFQTFDPIMHWLKELAKLPNVTVRPSALNFGDYAPRIAGLNAGSTAGMLDALRAKQCPAKNQGNQCGECRACWTEKDTPISYAKH